MEYKIVTQKYYQDLENEVNNLIKNGWKPQGGVAILYDSENGRTEYYQAMVK